MRLKAICLLFVLGTCLPNLGVALDPCGMVPPIYTGNIAPIARIGLQQTYVFYRDGVEAVVIRPGFSGKVDNFGMLIPFPAPPELRKVPDNVFEQIDNAIDPPEIVVNLQEQFLGRNLDATVKAMRFDSKAESLKKNQVKVVKQEAVGMYEVAVLEAGSANALKIWLQKNGFQYPQGMDDVANEYVNEGWCFVAVKTKVGNKAAADPTPGQRDINTNLPSGSVFDGHVQGMGFRFPSSKLVVPMRLSAFNDGDLRNIVYVLTDGPKRIRNIPEEYVVRQVSGEQLINNLTLPLPLRIIGGTEKDIEQNRRTSLKTERDPRPKNGVAKTLFASDLLAVSTGKLSLLPEENEKQMLAINEHFGLRGPEIDAVLLKAQQKETDKIAEQSLALLNGMTLTVVDGDFPRQVIANQNLKFADFMMPPRRNQADIYDSKVHGKPQDNFGGIRIGQMDLETWEERKQVGNFRRNLLIAGCFSIGVVLTLRRRRR